jgi:hypothetical protein
MWAGMAAMILGAVAPCMCSAPWLVSFPLACWALYKGLEARQAALSVTATNAATAGILSGIFGVVFGLIFIGLFLFYLLYFALIMGVGIFGAGF